MGRPRGVHNEIIAHDRAAFWQQKIYILSALHWSHDSIMISFLPFEYNLCAMIYIHLLNSQQKKNEIGTWAVDNSWK